VLLYPRVPGVEPKRYSLPVLPMARDIRVEFVDLSKDLLKHRAEFVAELQRILNFTADTPMMATV
jgi:hypothetical protein